MAKGEWKLHSTSVVKMPLPSLAAFMSVVLEKIYRYFVRKIKINIACENEIGRANNHVIMEKLIDVITCFAKAGYNTLSGGMTRQRVAQIKDFS